MNIYDATETAYKNGYEAGAKEFMERAKERAIELCDFYYVVEMREIINILKELMEENR